MIHFLKIAGIAVLLTLLCNYLIFHSPLKYSFYLYDMKAYDYAVFEAHDTEEFKIEEIVIIDIDNYSVDRKRLGKFHNWPLDFHAKLIENITRDNPKAIAFDVILPEDMVAERNNMLVEASKKSGKVIGALAFVDSDPERFLNPDPIPPNEYDYKRDSYDVSTFKTKFRKKYDILDAPFGDLLNANLANGTVIFEPDFDGVIRRIRPTTHYFGREFPFLGMQMFIKTNDIQTLSFASEDTLKLIDGKNKTIRAIPIDNEGRIRITYHGGFNKFRTISYAHIINNDDYSRLPKDFFKDKYVLVGSSLAGLYDLRSTPINSVSPGVGIHANVLKTILDENYTKTLSEFHFTVLLFLFILFVISIVNYLRIMVAAVIIAFLLALTFIVSLLIFETSLLWLQYVNIFFAVVLTTITMYAYKYQTEEKNKKMIRGAFSQFVTEAVVDELLSDPSKLKLGGEKKNCTVFFSDVAGFTTISEQLEPEELVKLLNIYLTAMTDIIFEHKGMIDKYIGDAIMAVYGAPVETGNHAYQACRSAIDQQMRLLKLQDQLREEGLPHLIARMGINTGEMVVGNMGSEEYFNYTVMGDNVNLAARLEPANKEYDTLIIIGHNTYELAKEFIFARQLDFMVVKGKTEPIRVFELCGMVEYGLSENDKKVFDLYNKGYELYLERNWDEALQCFEQAVEINPNDGPSLVYIDRCKEYKLNEPDESWSGVYVMTHK